MLGHRKKWRATILRSLTIRGVGFAIDLATLTGSPKSAPSWWRYDNISLPTVPLLFSMQVPFRQAWILLSSMFSPCCLPVLDLSAPILHVSRLAQFWNTSYHWNSSQLTHRDSTTKRGVHNDSQNQVTTDRPILGGLESVAWRFTVFANDAMPTLETSSVNLNNRCRPWNNCFWISLRNYIASNFFFSASSKR